MYNINEIEYQNKQDCFSLLYLKLGRSLMDYCGRKAEGALREAVRRMGSESGELIRIKFKNEGIRTNLMNLSILNFACSRDPRMKVQSLEETEQVRLWEVYTCPLAVLWNKANEAKLGSFYCEEYLHAFLEGYTMKKGQMNLSDLMTCPRDLHCRFSAYYRPANTNGTQREESFSPYGSVCKEEHAKSAFISDNELHELIKSDFIRLYFYILEVASEKFGKEGICAISNGLRKFKEEVITLMVKKAADVLKPSDNSFFSLNFPVSIDINEDLLWEKYKAHDAPMLMSLNLLCPLKKHFNLN